MAAILVYGELSDGKATSTSLEIVSKARELGDVYAVALGTGAKAAAAVLGKHGAKAVHVNQDKAFDDYIAEPATDALASLFEKEKPDLILFVFPPSSREVAGRLAERLRVGIIANTGDLHATDGGLVDPAWVRYSMQVGQAGTSVRPGVYIAVGISGARQPTVGMKTSKIIIAINKDAEAPIMKLADLGVVGAALKILPALTAAVKAKKNG